MMVDVGRRDRDGGRRINIDETSTRKFPRGGEVFKVWKLPGTNQCHSANVE